MVPLEVAIASRGKINNDKSKKTYSVFRKYNNRDLLLTGWQMLIRQHRNLLK